MQQTKGKRSPKSGSHSKEVNPSVLCGFAAAAAISQPQPAEMLRTQRKEESEEEEEEEKGDIFIPH